MKPLSDAERKRLREICPVANALYFKTIPGKLQQNVIIIARKLLAQDAEIEQLSNPPECSCYESEYGHQMGCAYYGQKHCRECGRWYTPKEPPC